MKMNKTVIFKILKLIFDFFFVMKDEHNPVTKDKDKTPVVYSSVSSRPSTENNIEPSYTESISENPQSLGIIEPDYSVQAPQESQQFQQPQTNQSMSKLNILKKFLSPSQYVNQASPKTGIVLHHTVGGTWESTWNFWENQKERVATHFIIDRDGTVVQCLPLEVWAFHIYIGSPGNKVDRKHKQKSSLYDRSLIGIELCSYGPLSLRNNNYITVYNKQISEDKVEQVEYKGFKYWEGYTAKQIESLELLLLDLIEKFPHLKKHLINDYSSIFNISEKALNLEPGIWSHTSLRTDKSDCYPSPALVLMLNNLKSKV